MAAASPPPKRAAPTPRAPAAEAHDEGEEEVEQADVGELTLFKKHPVDEEAEAAETEEEAAEASQQPAAKAAPSSDRGGDDDGGGGGGGGGDGPRGWTSGEVEAEVHPDALGFQSSGGEQRGGGEEEEVEESVNEAAETPHTTVVTKPTAVRKVQQPTGGSAMESRQGSQTEDRSQRSSRGSGTSQYDPGWSTQGGSNAQYGGGGSQSALLLGGSQLSAGYMGMGNNAMQARLMELQGGGAFGSSGAYSNGYEDSQQQQQNMLGSVNTQQYFSQYDAQQALPRGGGSGGSRHGSGGSKRSGRKGAPTHEETAEEIQLRQMEAEARSRLAGIQAARLQAEMAEAQARVRFSCLLTSINMARWG